MKTNCAKLFFLGAFLLTISAGVSNFYNSPKLSNLAFDNVEALASSETDWGYAEVSYKTEPTSWCCDIIVTKVCVGSGFLFCEL